MNLATLLSTIPPSEILCQGLRENVIDIKKSGDKSKITFVCSEDKADGLMRDAALGRTPDYLGIVIWIHRKYIDDNGQPINPVPNILTCVYCGHQYPEGTPPAHSEILTEHIKICEQHPMRDLEVEVAELRKDRDRLNWLESQVKPSRTGISFDWVPREDENEPAGFRFMRQHWIGPAIKTLRGAIDKAQSSLKS
jgi:hypothetical protein